MNRRKLLVVLVFLSLFTLSSASMIFSVHAQAASSTDSDVEPKISATQVSYPYVDCDTMGNVFAYDVAKGQDPNDFNVFLGKVSEMGHTVAVWNTTKDGAPPPCVEKLMIVSAVHEGCLGWNPYTESEAAVIASWVQDGGNLFLMEEHYYCSAVHNITKALGYTPQEDPHTVTDTDYDPNYWPVFQFDNFNIHPIFGERGKECYIGEVKLLMTGWWVPDDGWVIRADNDGTADPSGAVVAAAFNYGSGKVFMIGDYDWLIDSYCSEFDNLQFGVNVVRWLNDMPVCPAEPVGGELIPLNLFLTMLPYITVAALIVLTSLGTAKKIKT